MPGMNGKRLRRSVPARFVVPHVKTYIVEQQMLTGAIPGDYDHASPKQFNETGDPSVWGHHAQDNRIRFAVALNVLAAEAGINEDTLRKYTQGDRKWISFDKADRLFAAMNMTHLWWEWPLVVFYLTVDLSGDPELRSNNTESSRSKCRRGHEHTPENTVFLKNGKTRCRKCNNALSMTSYRRRAVVTA